MLCFVSVGNVTIKRVAEAMAAKIRGAVGAPADWWVAKVVAEMLEEGASGLTPGMVNAVIAEFLRRRLRHCKKGIEIRNPQVYQVYFVRLFHRMTKVRLRKDWRRKDGLG